MRYFDVLHHQQGRYKEKLSLVYNTLEVAFILRSFLRRKARRVILYFSAVQNDQGKKIVRQQDLNQVCPILVFYAWHCIVGHGESQPCECDFSKIGHFSEIVWGGFDLMIFYPFLARFFSFQAIPQDVRISYMYSYSQQKTRPSYEYEKLDWMCGYGYSCLFWKLLFCFRTWSRVRMGLATATSQLDQIAWNV